MGALKAVLKLMFVLIVAASIAGVVMLVKRSDAEPVSYDEWPDVPRNPESQESASHPKEKS